MKLKKIVQGYQLSEKFCEFMEDFEKKQTMYGELGKNSKYFDWENLTQYMMQNHKPEMIVGSFGYLFRHPIKMFNSQKYYNESFGKPCEIKN